VKSLTDGKQSSRDTKQVQKERVLRNYFEKYNDRFSQIAAEDNTEKETKARIVEATKKFAAVLAEAKPDLKLYELLGQNET